jgi:thioredoxin reductase (NADPH)
MSQHGEPAQEYEVAIVGAGPIGIELAVAFKRAGVSHVHFEAKQVGQTVSWWAPQTRWFSSNDRIAIAGVPLVTPDQNKSTREQYLAYLRQVVTQFDLPLRLYEPVTHIARRSDGRYDITSHPRTGPTHTIVKRIVLCTGGTDRPRKLNIHGEDMPFVSSYFNEPHTYFRQRLLIIGGRNSAVEAALRCHHAGAKVILSYRQPQLPEKSIKYWLMPEIKGLIQSGAIDAHFETVPTKIEPGRVTLQKLRDGQPVRNFDVPCDFVLKQIGYEQDHALLKLAGIELVGPDRAPRFDPATMETNQPGIYVAGTAVGGTQTSYKLFLENCHEHVAKITQAITGRAIDVGALASETLIAAQPES